MKCAIMQPTYIPWLGYFDLIDSVDKFVFLDDVKLEKCSWQVRNRIKTCRGELFLTIPVRRTKGRDKLMINEAIINDNEPWRKNHLKSIFYTYKKSAFFDEVYSLLEKLINSNIVMLKIFNISIINFICNRIGIYKEFILSSDLKNLSGEKDARLLSICKRLNCNKYISPFGSAVYIEKKLAGGAFSKSNVDLYYQSYQHPIYTQLYGDFISHMSAIDLFFNHGFKKSLEIIRSERRKLTNYLSLQKNVLSILES